MSDNRRRKRGEEITHRPKLPQKSQIIVFCEGDTEKIYFPSFQKYRDAKKAIT